MDKNSEKTSRLDLIFRILLGIAMAAVAAFIIWGIVGISKDIDDTWSEIKEFATHKEAENNISSGVITDKKIVNGRTVSGGGIVAGSNGSGVIIGGNGEYIPAQYRLYVKGEYEVAGEVFEGERYFDVPFEIYQAYSVGDFFDSQNLSSDSGE